MTPPEPVESRERWRQALDAYLARRERTRRLRAELAAARAAGLAARHATRLRRTRAGDTKEGKAMTTTTRPTDEQIRDQVADVMERATGYWRAVSDVGPCDACGEHVRIGIEVDYRPRVCSCSDADRPTMDDPCREVACTVLCTKCQTHHAADLAHAERLAWEAEHIGSGEYIRLPGGRAVKAAEYDPAVHGPTGG